MPMRDLYREFAELMEKAGLSHTRPADDHVPAPGCCPRCEWDMAVYGEAFWDAGTGEHLKVERLMRKLPQGEPE